VSCKARTSEFLRGVSLFPFGIAARYGALSSLRGGGEQRMSLILSVAKGRQLRQLFPLDTIYYILTFLLSHINWAKCKVPYLWCFAPDLFDHIVIITVPQLLTTLSTKPTILRRAKNLKDAFSLTFSTFLFPFVSSLGSRAYFNLSHNEHRPVYSNHKDGRIEDFMSVFRRGFYSDISIIS
jgi:hypothetical protein